MAFSAADTMGDFALVVLVFLTWAKQAIASKKVTIPTNRTTTLKD